MTKFKSIRSEYIKFTKDINNAYHQYQLSKDQSLEGIKPRYFWFTIKINNPNQSWEAIQLGYHKYVRIFHSSISDKLNGPYFNRPKNKHLKPFIAATIDFEASNEYASLKVNQFNHIHGLLVITNKNIENFLSSLIRKDKHYIYGEQLESIREVTTEHIDLNDDGLSKYINYINKNAGRKNMNLNPNIFLPNNQSFKDFLAETKPVTHIEGSRFNNKKTKLEQQKPLKYIHRPQPKHRKQREYKSSYKHAMAEKLNEELKLLNEEINNTSNRECLQNLRIKKRKLEERIQYFIGIQSDDKNNQTTEVFPRKLGRRPMRNTRRSPAIGGDLNKVYH